MKKFTYGKTEYTYHLDQHKRKSFALTIHPNQSITLKAPLVATDNDIDTFLKKKSLWIDKQINFFKQFKNVSREKEFVSGEKFLYLGRRYMLKVQKSDIDDVSLRSGRLMVSTSQKISDTDHIKSLLDSWFLNRSKIIFNEQFVKMMEKFDYDFVPELVTRKMSKRWGSYHVKGKIILNPILIHATKKSIDYVITHELCHAKHHNHSKEYYNFLDSKFPNWKLEKQKLETLIFNDF